MSALQQAMTLVGQDPLPGNVREQLKELEPQIDEFEMEWIYECLAQSEMSQGIFDEEDEWEGGPKDNTPED